MLSFTRKTDYALVALAELARATPNRLSARELAGRLGVSGRVLTNVLNQLTHHEMVVSHRGATGGYGLAREASSITLTELIEAVEGPVRLAKCCSDGDGGAFEDDAECGLESSCQIKEPVRRLHANLRHFFGQISVSDLAFDTVPLRVGGVDSGRAVGVDPVGVDPVGVDPVGVNRALITPS